VRIVLTGCNGKLGQAVADLLVSRAGAVAGIDLTPAPNRPHRVVIDDLRRPEAIHRALDLLDGPPDALIHLANHTNSMVAPAEVVLRENLAMNASVFMAAIQRGVRRIAFASSIQAMLPNMETDGTFGQRTPHKLPVSESIDPRPSNVYGVSKLTTERMLAMLCDNTSFKSPNAVSAVSVRLPYILGPQQFDAASKRAGSPEFMWGGAEAFAYIHVADAAEAMVLAADARLSGHEAVWCAAPDPRPAETVKSIVERFYASVDGAPEAVRRCSLVDCSRAEGLLGWKARHVLSIERRRAGLEPPGETGFAA